jgi:hypothetical protein
MIKTFDNLRQQSNQFVYRSYEILDDGETVSLIFNYELIEKNDITLFTHKLKLTKTEKISLEGDLNNIVFHIGMIEAINYWKIATPEDFIIRCGYLDDVQLQWFKKLYYNGLGEFLYINDISITLDDFINFIFEGKKEKFNYIKQDTKENNIIPIGGGKDSLVTYELLKDSFPDSYMFSMNPIKASQNILDQHPDNSIILSRVLDSKILTFNKNGYLNGHIPFSSILGFISIWLGLIYKTRYIVLSNESSANEENIIFNGLKVNHQYSKSLEFEDDFRAYIKDYITADVEYFSFLRPLDEIHIAKLFSQTKKHFHTFLSCNVGSRKNIWCGKCPKCMFTYIMLCNHIDNKTLFEIFGKDMLDDKELIGTFDQLSKSHEVKPFECVGTYDEVNYAIQQKIKEYANNDLPYLLAQYDNSSTQEYNFIIDYENNNNLPKKYKNILKENVEKLNTKSK